MTPAFFLEMGWKSVLVVALGLGLVGLMRHRSAADRVFLLRLVVLLLLALPLTAAFGPSLEVERPGALAMAGGTDAPATRSHMPATGEAGMRQAPPPARAAPAVDWPLALLVVYGLGVGGVLSHLATGIWTLRQWTRAASPVVHPLWDAAHERARYRTGVKRPVDVLMSPHVSAPLGWRFRRPAILLDRQTVRRDEQAEAVLAHEFAHIARADWPMLLVSRLMLALFWFNPLAWLLDRRLVEQSEEAADMSAVRRLDPGAYAQALLSAAAPAGQRGLPATPMVAPAGLDRRIGRVLDESMRNRLSGSVWTMLAGCGVFAAALAISMLQLVPAKASVAAKPHAAATAVSSGPFAPGGGPAGLLAEAAAVKAGEEPGMVTAALQAVPAPAPAALPAPAPDAAVPAPRATPVAPAAPAAPATPPVPPLPPARGVDELTAAMAQLPGAASQGRSAAAQARTIAIASRERALADMGEAERQRWEDGAALRAMGITFAYMQEMASALRIRRISEDDAIGLKSMGITPERVRGIVDAGYRGITVDELHELAAMSITPAYIRELAAAGWRGLSIDELVELKAIGVSPEFARKARRQGLASCAEELVELRATTGSL